MEYLYKFGSKKQSYTDQNWGCTLLVETKIALSIIIKVIKAHKVCGPQNESGPAWFLNGADSCSPMQELEKPCKVG